ncbi:MAG TPA: response regulator, partial [Solirubrobacteraceae bacterium]|nr:response regulator [Solirubrobacteraceae bacterium]
MRILVVDDDRAVREALRRALTLGGYDVQLAAGGAQALELVVQALPDAVVLDIGMPDIDGLEVCRRLRLLGNRVPILMLTARDAVADRIDGLDVGADDYMVKPFDIGELAARLRALLRRVAPDGDGSPEAPAFAEIRLDPGRHGAVVGDDGVRGAAGPDGGVGAGARGAAGAD